MAAAWCSAARRPASSSAPAQLRDAPDLQRVRALARDRLGRLWIASRDAGVAIFDARSGELHRLRHSPTEPNSLSDNSVFSILHLRNGDTLIGTARGLDRTLGRQSRRHAHRAAARNSRRRASRCACAR